MEWVEMTAPTVEEATRRALEQLGVVEADAEIVVVEEPRTGLFGRLKGEARVRARVRPTGPRPKRSRRGKARGGGSTRPGEGGGARQERAERPDRPERQDAQGGRDGAPRSGSRSRSRRGRRGGGGGQATQAGGGAVAVKANAPMREDDGMAEGMT